MSPSRNTTLILGPPPSQILFSDCQHLTPAMFAPRHPSFPSSSNILSRSLHLRLYRGRCRRCDLTLTTLRAAAKQATLRTMIEGLDRQIRELEGTIVASSGFGSVVFGKLEELRWRQERLRMGTEERVAGVWRRFEEKWGRRDGRDLMYG